VTGRSINEAWRLPEPYRNVRFPASVQRALGAPALTVLAHADQQAPVAGSPMPNGIGSGLSWSIDVRSPKLVESALAIRGWPLRRRPALALVAAVARAQLAVDRPVARLAVSAPSTRRLADARVEVVHAQHGAAGLAASDLLALAELDLRRRRHPLGIARASALALPWAIAGVVLAFVAMVFLAEVFEPPPGGLAFLGPVASAVPILVRPWWAGRWSGHVGGELVPGSARFTPLPSEPAR
jgi:hypothetical protein